MIDTYILESDSQFDNLKVFVQENGNNMQAGDMEKTIHHQLLKIGKSLLQSYFANIKKNDEGPSITTEKGVELTRHGSADKNYLSIYGKIRINRTRYWDKGEKSIFPLDAACNLPQQQYSYYLQEFMNSMSISNTFGQAGDKLEQFLNLKLEESVLETVNQTGSTHYAAFYEQKAVPDIESEGEIQAMSFDGKGVPMIKKEAAKIKGRLGPGEKRQKKKEALVGVVYSVDKKNRSPEEVANNLIYPETKKNKIAIPKAKNIRRLASITSPKADVIKQLQQESIRRNPDGKKDTVVLIDGSLYLWDLVKKNVTHIEGHTVILDIIHVLEYIYLAAHSLYKVGSPQAKAYAHKTLLRILKGQVTNVIGYLKTSSKRKKLDNNKRESLKKVITYFTNHKQIMQYDVYLALGYPIGTGVVESTCKLLVNDRMEGSGMRWSLEGAEAMLKMRSVEKSHDMKEYNLFFRKQEERRLYKAKNYELSIDT